MSATGDLVIAIQEEEMRTGRMNAERLQEFIGSYTKARDPRVDLSRERQQHRHDVNTFNQTLQQRFK